MGCSNDTCENDLLSWVQLQENQQFLRPNLLEFDTETTRELFSF